MEFSNKENENKLKTKIPLPVPPLPSLPKHLLIGEKKKEDNKNVRNPLKTINTQFPNQISVAGPSKKLSEEKPLKIDTRYVTIRNNNIDYDRDFEILNDNRDENKNKNVIFITNDEECSASKDSKNVDGVKIGNPVTPSLEHNRVKNIKQTLRRSHSRELQGLSPLPKKQKRNCEVVKRLQFEVLQNQLEPLDHWSQAYTARLMENYSSEIYSHLMSIEKKPLDIPHIPSRTRACVIHWLMRVNGSGGNPAITQTACWYLDSVLGTGSVELDHMQLVAAACYWIAQKLHGPNVSVNRLIKCSNRAFTLQKLEEAERAVMVKLKFPAQPVIPQEFISYLSYYCDNKQPGEIEVAATFFCMAGMIVDKTLCSEYPSVIAAAAVRNALLLLGKRDLMIRLELCPEFSSAEKKATDLQLTCSILRKAVRTVASPTYEYNIPFKQYDTPPHFIAQRIIKQAQKLAIMDARKTEITK